MREIWCCNCEGDVEAERVTGADIYPHIRKLAGKTFWRCPVCRNYVGSHGDGRPLGCIPTPELRKARSMIHGVLDPIWKQGLMPRGELYRLMSERLEIPGGFHTAEIRSIEAARAAYRAARHIRLSL